MPHAFWREFRQILKQINPEIYILGENWDNSYPWLMGDQFDGVMNYELTYPIWSLLGESDRVKQKYDVVQYQEAINQLLANYPKHNLPAMYNLIDSHDTPRIMSICGDNVDKVKLAYLITIYLRRCTQRLLWQRGRVSRTGRSQPPLHVLGSISAGSGLTIVCEAFDSSSKKISRFW